MVHHTINIYDIILIFLFVILSQPNFENNYNIYYTTTSYLLGIDKFKQHDKNDLFDRKYDHLVPKIGGPLGTRPFIFFGNGIIPVPFVYTRTKKSGNKF